MHKALSRRFALAAAALPALLAAAAPAEPALSPRQPYPPVTRPPYELKRPDLPAPPPKNGPAIEAVAPAPAADPRLSGYIVFVAGALLLFRKPD